MNGLDDNSRRTLQILDEVAKDNRITQRALSERLGVALGCTNLYLKRLIKKGYIKVKGIPGRRYLYYLTPTGFAEKTALSLRYMQFSWRYYQEVREQWCHCFEELQTAGVERVILYGADEMAELAYLSLRDTKLEVIAVVDDERIGESFCGHKIEPLFSLEGLSYDRIILGSVEQSTRICEILISQGIEEKQIIGLNSGISAR